MRCVILIFILIHISKSLGPTDEVTINADVPVPENSCMHVLETITETLEKYWSTSKKTDSRGKDDNNEVICSNEGKKETHHHARNCFELQQQGDKESGIRTIFPFKDSPDWQINVVCDQETDEGGWNVIQVRDARPIRENFYRSWIEYSLGFGNMTGEFWLGLDIIHALTGDFVLMELRVDIEDTTGDERVANYEYFSVANSERNFLLSVGGYSGNAGDGMKYHDNNVFTTRDRANILVSGKNSADLYNGGWWYGPGHHANLNGYQHYGDHASYADGVGWFFFRGHNNSMKKAKMMIRPSFNK